MPTDPAETALLAAVAAAPAADAPRLIYADWLDERGDARRAEFIRLQCEIATKETLPRRQLDRFAPLWRRAQDLRDDHWAEIAGPVAEFFPTDTAAVTFRRGFLESVTLDADRFLGPAGAMLAALVPAPRVRLTDALRRLRALAHVSDRLKHVVGIRALGEPADPLDFPAIYPAEFDIARFGPALANVEELDLEGAGLGDYAMPFLGALVLPKLHELDLSGNLISDFGLTDLIGSPLLRPVRRLILGNNPIGDAGAFELSDRTPRDSPLEHLNLRFTHIGSPGHAALTARFGGKIDLF